MPVHERCNDEINGAVRCLKGDKASGIDAQEFEERWEVYVDENVL